MKTKAEIVQRLLTESKIDAEEAVILLMNESAPVQFVPYPVYPWHPYPYNPVWINATSGKTTANGPIAIPTFTN